LETSQVQIKNQSEAVRSILAFYTLCLPVYGVPQKISYSVVLIKSELFAELQ